MNIRECSYPTRGMNVQKNHIPHGMERSSLSSYNKAEMTARPATVKISKTLHI